MLGFATVALCAAAMRGAVGDLGLLTSLTALATMGAVIAGLGAFRLPGWARLRRRQMEGVAARVAAVASLQSAHDSHNEP